MMIALSRIQTCLVDEKGGSSIGFYKIKRPIVSQAFATTSAMTIVLGDFLNLIVNHNC
jgi:hypothetical protein